MVNEEKPDMQAKDAEQQAPKCPSCGFELRAGSRFCDNCGAKLNGALEQPEPGTAVNAEEETPEQGSASTRPNPPVDVEGAPVSPPELLPVTMHVQTSGEAGTDQTAEKKPLYKKPGLWIAITALAVLIVAIVAIAGGSGGSHEVTQPPSGIKYKTVKSSNRISTTPTGNFTYEVGTEWEEGKDPGVYYPSGFVKAPADTMLFQSEGALYYSDYKTKMSISDLSDQYDYLMKQYFTNSDSEHGWRYTNIRKGTIGGNACIKADSERSPSENSTGSKGVHIYFFIDEGTVGGITTSYAKGYEKYADQMAYTVYSVKLKDGSTASWTGTIDPIRDNGDASELDSLISKAKKLDKANYTPASWEILEKALGSAESIRSNSSSRQVDYNSKALDLKYALEQLKEQPNKSNYESISYENLARTPDTYKGKKIVITGRVLQVSEGKNETDLRVATSGRYDDVVMVGYDPKTMTSRILEDDQITAYGSYVGMYTYEAVSGASISVPAVYADLIEIG